jgi:hypothetical protein
VEHPYEWLRYLDADNLDDSTVDFSRMTVESTDGERLGSIAGFIVDAESGRPYYVVVDAGGWFKSKHFLLPVGHAVLDTAKETLRTDLSLFHVKRFPGFDRDEFGKLSAEDLKRLNDETCSACVVGEVTTTYSATEPYSAAWSRPDFEYPNWWRSSSMGEPGQTRAGEGAAAGDPSPHHAGRAQPGDVIGVETEGERSYLGDTATDENSRREDAEKTAAGRRR